jgi:hypothetical protein
MISMFIERNVLYYASNGIACLDDLNTQCGSVWRWNEAPQEIRQAYRNRTDFWAIAPNCVAREWSHQRRYGLTMSH